MVFSLTEAGARLFVTRFFRQFISIGCVTILEGDTIFIFGENESTCPLKSILKIHSPQFYWKVMTLADLGLADAYINGDFSFVDKDSGLLNLIMILIANRDLNSRKSNLAKKRGWWTPVFLTASLASATYYLKHVCRQNTLTQARRNVSSHYDLVRA
jgi:cyclopropane-fatty-acyl-phospholipid synthase